MLNKDLQAVCSMQDAKRKREDLGVELFGFQQQLRGIFQSLDEGEDRASQLKLLNDMVKKSLTAKMQDVAQTQSTVIVCTTQVCNFFNSQSADIAVLHSDSLH